MYYLFLRPINDSMINQKPVNSNVIQRLVSPVSRGSFRMLEKTRKLVPRMGVIFIFSRIWLLVDSVVTFTRIVKSKAEN